MMSNVASQPSISGLGPGQSCLSTYDAVMMNANNINAALGSNAVAVGVFSNLDQLQGLMGLIGDQQLTALDIMTHGGLLQGNVNQPFMAIPGATYTLTTRVDGGMLVQPYPGYAAEYTIRGLRSDLMPNTASTFLTHCGPGPTAWTQGVSQVQAALGAGQAGVPSTLMYLNR